MLAAHVQALTTSFLMKALPPEVYCVFMCLSDSMCVLV